MASLRLIATAMLAASLVLGGCAVLDLKGYDGGLNVAPAATGFGQISALAQIPGCTATTPAGGPISLTCPLSAYGSLQSAATLTLSGVPAGASITPANTVLIIQVTAGINGISGTYSGPTIGNLGVTAANGVLAADGSTTIVPDPGMRLWIIDAPSSYGTYGFTVNFQDSDDQPGARSIKFMLAAKVSANGRTYYAPVFPCTASFAAVPAITLPTASALVQVNLAPLAAQSGCSNKAYDFAAVTTVEVVEFYNVGFDHYFITWGTAEIGALDAGTVIKGWVRTGHKFKAYAAAVTGSADVCRFYIPPALGDSHFFGRGAQECADTKAKFPLLVEEEPKYMQMKLPVAGVCPAGTVNIYRVFSGRADANHRYMTDKGLRDVMVASGWVAEGDGPDLVVMCAPA